MYVLRQEINSVRHLDLGELRESLGIFVPGSTQRQTYPTTRLPRQGRVLGLIFAGYVQLASQSPYCVASFKAHILVTFGQICNFGDPNLISFYFYELTPV